MSAETNKSSLRRLNSRRVVALLARYGTLAGLAVMIVGFSIASPNAFPTFSNFVNIVNQVALTAIIAGGLTIVLIVGELDLSVGFGGEPGRSAGDGINGPAGPPHSVSHCSSSARWCAGRID